MNARTFLLSSLLLASGCTAQNKESAQAGPPSPTPPLVVSAAAANSQQTNELQEAGKDSAGKQAEAEKLLERGEIRRAKDLVSGILYGQRTVGSKEWGAKFLRAAHKHALDAFRQGKAEKAYELMETAFQYSGGFVRIAPEDIDGERLVEPPVFILDEKLYEKDFSAHLPRAEYIEIAGDYGFFLEQAGGNRKDVEVLQQVVRMSPERESARLNLGDALWKRGDKEKAIREYKEYKNLMASKKQLDKVPSRVEEHIKN